MLKWLGRGSKNPLPHVTGHSGSLVEIAERLPWQWRIALPLGGVAAGFLLMWARRYAAGTSDYMEAVAIGDGRVPAAKACCAASRRW
ncbi:hypothetical protein UB44_16625 [Burkholderiaceae bacterium 26]|nr:hypothetical protein UB44_16625 [Burkholderiaceae bacterium 26]